MSNFIVSRINVAAGQPHLEGHRLTVQSLVILRERRGLTPAAIAVEYGLRLPEIQAAYDYYAANQSAVQLALLEDATFIKDLRARTPTLRTSGRPGVPLRYYLDESVGRSVAAALEEQGIEVLTAVEADMLGATDDQHLAFSVAEKRVLFSQDTACLRWHASGLWHRGLVFANLETPPEAASAGLLRLHNQTAPDDLVGQLVFID